MAAKINGFSLAYTAFGGVILWSGIKGETLSATFRGLLAGKGPSQNQQPIAGPAATSDGAGGTGAAAAARAAAGAATATSVANKALGADCWPPGYGSGTGQQELAYLASGWR